MSQLQRIDIQSGNRQGHFAMAGNRGLPNGLRYLRPFLSIRNQSDPDATAVAFAIQRSAETIDQSNLPGIERHKEIHCQRSYVSNVNNVRACFPEPAYPIREPGR